MKQGLSYMLDKHPYLTVLLTIPIAIWAVVDGVSTGVEITSTKKETSK